MALSKQKVQAKYESGAKYYDFYVWLYGSWNLEL